MMRLARAADWPTIAFWRAAHHATMARRNSLPLCDGARFEDAVWVVAERDGKLLAATSFFDKGATRTMCDFYWRPGFAGARAAYRLAGTVLYFAAQLQLQVEGDTNISNWEYRAIIERVGFRIYYYDYTLDVCYFRRERSEGFGYVGKFKSDHADQRQRSRPRPAAAADAGAAYHGAANQQCAH